LFSPLSADVGVEGGDGGNVSKRNAGGFSVKLGGRFGTDTGECGIVVSHEANVNAKTGSIFWSNINGYLFNNCVAFFSYNFNAITVLNFDTTEPIRNFV